MKIEENKNTNPSEPFSDFNIPLANELILRLKRIRVLRSACEDSHGNFRIHLPESDWDKIVELVNRLSND